jgi:hypothetical protein
MKSIKTAIAMSAIAGVPHGLFTDFERGSRVAVRR